MQHQGVLRIGSQDSFSRKSQMNQLHTTPSHRKTSQNKQQSIDQIPDNALEKFYLYKQKKNDIRMKQQLSKQTQRSTQNSIAQQNKFFINANFVNNQGGQQKRSAQSVTIEAMESVKRTIKTDMGNPTSVLSKAKSLGPDEQMQQVKHHNVVVRFGNQDFYFYFDSHLNMRQIWFQILQRLHDLEFANPQECYANLKDKPSVNQIVSFVSQQHSISIDYYIAQPDLSFNVFMSSGLKLEAFLLQASPEPKVGLKDFIFLKNIGVGGFSLVYLVRKKDTGKFYALKLIDKEFIIAKKKQQIVLNERNIMTLLNSPFLLHLSYAFESRQFVVFVLEFCQGGELFFQLKQIKRMSEEQACFYISEICLGLQEIHSLNILYRDIKPENILMDIEGHVRIADFGLSKPEIGREEKAYSFCGSPEYMAPEMLLKLGHSQTVDFYCLGALLYELLTGLPPYYSTNTNQIYQDILYSKLSFPNDLTLSREVKSLLIALLEKDPIQRLGAKGGVQEILKHPFFSQIDFKQLALKKVKPPFKPDPLKMNLDEKESQRGEQDFRKKIAQGKTMNLPVIFGSSFFYESPQEAQTKSVYKEWISHTNLQPNTPCVASYHSQGRSAKSQDIIPLIQSVKNNPRSRQMLNQKQNFYKASGQKLSLERINQEKKFFSKV
ncbi:unnamed protein product (macronuclear) [Paramecium tetraurelia]|uniref:Protein kinase domain-containing protein n=1 Tax=Paramecium tetraurelia TaxID=5888 RepID=A0BNJ0_PARTE|nr:uncharacterized protein GSPATT00030745001 [Paramecium tetraurelia]CAK60107.1 unnamed protein product [Paramecium tetraurelia]|eukprot:XP_001427505.1 hypothetical protein (macronuclear) [Paramecium tetraurelia strain d4-2]